MNIIRAYMNIKDLHQSVHLHKLITKHALFCLQKHWIYTVEYTNIMQGILHYLASLAELDLYCWHMPPSLARLELYCWHMPPR